MEFQDQLLEITTLARENLKNRTKMYPHHNWGRACLVFGRNGEIGLHFKYITIEGKSGKDNSN